MKALRMFKINVQVDFIDSLAIKMILWRCRDLNPGLSACEADTLPLSYTPETCGQGQFCKL